MLNNSILLKVAQEAAPALFIKRRNVGDHKVANSLFTLHHLTDVNRLIAGKRIGRHAAGRLNNLLNIAFRFNANQQVGWRIGAVFDRA